MTLSQQGNDQTHQQLHEDLQQQRQGNKQLLFTITAARGQQPIQQQRAPPLLP